MTIIPTLLSYQIIRKKKIIFNIIMQQLNESKMTFLKTIINFQLLMNLSQALSGQTFCLEINKSCFKTNKFSFT